MDKVSLPLVAVTIFLVDFAVRPRCRLVGKRGLEKKALIGRPDSTGAIESVDEIPVFSSACPC